MSARRHILLERPHGVDRTTSVRVHPCSAWPFLMSGTGQGLVVNVPAPIKERHVLVTKAAKRQRQLLKEADDAPF